VFPKFSAKPFLVGRKDKNELRLVKKNGRILITTHGWAPRSGKDW